MGVRRFEDLVAWQLIHELELGVFAFTARMPCSSDVRFCGQIQESARSAARNTAEGFGRYYPKEFARFLRIAAASLHETKNHLHHAHDRNYISGPEHDQLVRLCVRALAAISHLIKYLIHAVAPEPSLGNSPADSDPNRQSEDE